MSVCVSVCLFVRVPEGNRDLFGVGGCFSSYFFLLVIGLLLLVSLSNFEGISSRLAQMSTWTQQ